MENSVQQNTSRQGIKTASFITDDYKKGYSIPGLPYQEYGIVAKELWVKYNSRLRIVPGHDDQGNIFKQNINVNTYDESVSPENFLSNTFYMCSTITGFGQKKAGLIIDLPPGSRDRDMFSTSPIRYAQNIISNTVKNGKTRFKKLPCWDNWVDNRVGIFPYPKVSLLFQALAFNINGRAFTNGERQPIQDANGNPLPLYCLIVCSHKISWLSLAKALAEPLDPSKDLDAATNSKFGPIAEVEGNILYLNSSPQAGDPSRFYLRPSVQPPTSRGWNKEPLNLNDDFCRNIWVPWNKLLKFYTAQEQLELLAQEFGADTVNYLFKDNPAFSGLVIPDSIAAAGLGRYATGSDVGYTSSYTAPSTQAAPVMEMPAFMKAAKVEYTPKARPAQATKQTATELFTAAPASSTDYMAELDKIRRASSSENKTQSAAAMAASLLEESDDESFEDGEL